MAEWGFRPKRTSYGVFSVTYESLNERNLNSYLNYYFCKNLLFFISWKIGKLLAQSLRWKKLSHVMIMFSTSWLARSTLPCVDDFLGCPWTNFTFHSSQSMWMCWFSNSRPLSVCNIRGGPNCAKISPRISAIGLASFDCRARRCTNFVKWSWWSCLFWF